MQEYGICKTREGIDNDILYKQFQLLSLHGQNKDAFAKTKLGAWEYDIIAPYYKGMAPERRTRAPLRTRRGQVAIRA